MLFNSLSFFIFFPTVTVLYFLLPHRFRLWLLLAASAIFYSAFIPVYTLLLFGAIIIDYYLALFIQKDKTNRKLYLWLGIGINCAVLFSFKYFNFFNANIEALSQFLDWNYSPQFLQLALPLGLSFHTFQSISYLVEVYYKRQKAEKNFWIYALYVLFYPKLVAGPIERPQHLLPQFHKKHYFNYQDVTCGLRLMLWGFFKKIVIADRLAVVVNQIYSSPKDYTGFPLILATIFFAYQIYCDFSGYSDIARGGAKVMGFNLIDNFNKPYFSKSIQEFWRRWHISLSSWIRDYVYTPLIVYTPLRGKRVRILRVYLVILITFLITGLWHGANWTYVFWGLLNGFFIVASLSTSSIRKRLLTFLNLSELSRLYQGVAILVTFLQVCIALVFFRAYSLSDAFYILSNLFSGLNDLYAHIIVFNVPEIINNLVQKGLGFNDLQNIMIVFGSIIFLEIIQIMQKKSDISSFISQKPILIRWSFYYALVLSILFFGVFNKTQFIYFQF